jgi:hypothetical protein
MGSEASQHEVIEPAGHGRAVQAVAGTYITIEDIAGKHPSEWLSPSHTRMALMSMRMRVGDQLVRGPG